jgi:diguanylate cyclase (GGDEF)-like protein/PAS domain S-box-containing protein
MLAASKRTFPGCAKTMIDETHRLPPEVRLRVLVADDSSDFLAAAQTHLANLSWAEVVGSAADGAEAVALCVTLKPDLVLMDVSMPGLGGIEAARRITRQPGAPHVVLLSLHDNDEYRRHARAAGAEGYLAKSEFPDKLPDVVCRLFGPNRRRKPTGLAPSLLATAVEQTADTVIVTDRDGVIEYVNEGFEKTTGYHRAEAVGRRPSLVKSGEHPPEFYRMLWNTLLANKAFRAVFINRRKDGSLYHEQKTITPIKDRAGAITHFVSTGKDITEQTAQQTLLRAIFDAAPSCIKLMRTDGTLLQINAAGLAMLEADSAETVLGRSVFDLVAPEYRERLRTCVERAAHGERGSLEFEIVTLKGERRWADTHAVPFHSPATTGTPLLVAVTRDITARKRAERDLLTLTHYDVLTGLPNRLLFTDRLRQATVEAERHERLVGVALLDLDQFKKINDSLGHAAGDALLRQVGERLRAALRPGDTVAHFGADEFALVLADMAHVDDATAVLQKIRQAFTAPFLADGRELYLTASVGVTLFPFDDRDGAALLRNADAAMYRAKEAGRNTWQFYAADMTAKAQENLVIENALRGAVARGELTLHYQPQVDLASGRIVGVEALVRWQHPDLGNIGPDRFIPIAEETGLIVPLGAWVLRSACAQAARWHRAGFPGLRLAVNLSPRQLQRPGFPETVEQILRDTGLPAALLELELTEGVLLHSTESTVTALDKLHVLGARFAIDDFGTGYSSLAYLRRFPLDVLKIDQAFVRDIVTDPDDAAIVCAVIALARSLGVLVVAEGVETDDQLRFLRAHGCDVLQGYYLSRPKPAAAISELLKNGIAL